jgi:5-methylcytosine-specific restriction endonuclease McrA
MLCFVGKRVANMTAEEREIVRARDRERYRAAPEMKRERSRKRRISEPRANAEYLRKRRETDPEGVKTYAREWYAANAEKVREANRKRNAANPEANRERVYRWRAAKPEGVRAIAQRRRASIKTSTANAPTAAQLKALLKKPCHYCGNRAEHVDHYIPLAKGGAHTLDNLRPACVPCNLSKGAKLPGEWSGRLCPPYK